MSPEEERLQTLAWWEEFFDETYIRVAATFWPDEAERTQREVAAVQNTLNLKSGEHILDMCCGCGRHTIALTRAGYQVTGLDLSAPLLAKGQVEARRLGAAASFVQGDMRFLPFRGSLDAVISLFTSFGYFVEEEENQRVLNGVAATLRPGGQFLIDVMNRDWVIAHDNPRMWVEDKGMLFIEDATLEPFTSRRQGTLTCIIGQQRIIRAHNLRLYAAHELHAMITRAGLQILQIYGDLDQREFTLQSPHIVILAQKPSGSGTQAPPTAQ